MALASSSDEIIRLAGNLIACRDQSALQALLSNSAKSILSSEYSSLRLVTDDQGETVTLRRSGPDVGRSLAQLVDRLMSGWVVKYGRALNSLDLGHDARFPFLQDKELTYPAAMAAPIESSSGVAGVLVVCRAADRPYTDHDLVDLGRICELVAPAVSRLREDHRLAAENARLRGLLAQSDAVASLIGRSEQWNRVLSALSTVGPAETRVLLMGESGTGKELCARALHAMSTRRDGEFVGVNCAAIPEHLVESEFFGHVRGAFTGATRDYEGLFVRAEGGTLFLDEIGSTSAAVQSSLLRAIQEEEIRPVGSTKSRPVDVRIICSTSADLPAMVEQGTFRKDLFYRINVVTIQLPALRDRKGDIAVLADEFVRMQAQKHARAVRSISPEALVALESYSWPGNVRELANAIEHAVLFSQDHDGVLRLESLPEGVRLAIGDLGDTFPRIAEAGLDHFMEYLESRILRNALEQAEGNQSAAARALGINEKRMRDRMQKYGIRRDERRAEDHPAGS